MSTLLESLLSQAAHIGANTKVEIERAESILAKSRERAAEARDLLNERETAAKGFDAPRFMGLVEVGAAHGAAFNQETQDSVDAARAMAKAFMASYTGRTDKSLAGGALSNLAAVINTGKNAAHLRTMLASRVAHWQGVLDSAPEGESASDKAARIALAKRYTVTCGDAPNENGDWPKDSKTGAEKMPKFNGRPAVTINGVSIPFGRGTNRDSQIAAFADLFVKYGDRVFASDVVDAFLDNGGRYKADAESSLPDACDAVMTAIDQMMSLGGKGSGDESFLMTVSAVVSRIMKDGFRAGHIADPVQEAPESDTVGGADTMGGADTVGGADTLAGSAEDVLEGLGEGVALGAPSPAEEAPKAAPRARRPRREVQATA